MGGPSSSPQRGQQQNHNHHQLHSHSLSTRRTLNRALFQDTRGELYEAIFKAGIKAAIGRGVDAMIELGCDIALLAPISTGIYAGPVYRPLIKAEICDLIEEVMREQYFGSSGYSRAHYFTRIVLPVLPGFTVTPLRHEEKRTGSKKRHK